MAPSRTLNAGVLMLGVVHHAHAEFEELSDVAEVYQITTGSREKLIHDFGEGVYDNVVVISRTADSAKITGPFDAELISHLPRSVKFICHNGAGYDQIDVGACTERDILVSNTPSAVDAATANTTLFLILGALRCAWIPQTSIREGSWLGSSPFGRDPDGMTLGILGLGGIGTAVAKRASAFGFRLQYHNRTPVPGLSKIFGADEPRYVSFKELLETSDIISIHLPLAPATRGLIGARELEMMKQDAIIVNTARGPIIQEDALVHSLDSGKIWSVGLDVYENEPNVHPGLLKNPRAMLLPHIGTATTDTRKKMEIVVIDNVKNAITQGTLLTPVPEQRKHTPV